MKYADARARGPWVALALLLSSLAACAGPSGEAGPPEEEAPPEPASPVPIPYHAVAYHLDLSILAYQLYGQSLVWPIDPYYEERAKTLGTSRDLFMTSMRGWAQRRGAQQVREGAGLGAYRGPGVLGGFEDNARHDPILYSYGRLHPWGPALTNVAGRWTEYLTPAQITGRVREVHVGYRRTGGAEGEVVIDPVPAGREDRDADARDVLLAFEGGTGDKGEPGQPASQSLMGLVLLRIAGGGQYDVPPQPPR